MALAELLRAYDQRQEFARAVAPNAVGYIGLDTPVELITAAGFQPIQIIAPARGHGAEAFGEGVGHPLLRAIVAGLMQGAWGDLRRLVISTTPSFYVGLYAFLCEAQRAGGFSDLDIHLFDFNRAAGESGDLLRYDAMVGLKNKLEAWRGDEISQTSLRHAIYVHEIARDRSQALEGVRQEGRLKGTEALKVFGAAEAMEREEYNRSLAETVIECAGRAVLPGRRALYSGSPTPKLGLYEHLEARGYLIVGDDQDCGSRAIGLISAMGVDDLNAMAQFHLKRDPAPARWDTPARVRYLADFARRVRAETVLFHFEPWDHPPAWDYPAQKQALEAVGVRCELLEAIDA